MQENKEHEEYDEEKELEEYRAWLRRMAKAEDACGGDIRVGMTRPERVNLSTVVTRDDATLSKLFAEIMDKARSETAERERRRQERKNLDQHIAVPTAGR
jgi:hypothetical protein